MATSIVSMVESGIEDAAIMLMSMGEEQASEVFKHLLPKEVQRLGETIAKLKAIPRERYESVVENFLKLAEAEHMLVAD
jgi:flagellar motor switch protein FliG